MVHLAHPIGGGHGQSVQKRRYHGHVLAGPGEGWTQHPHVVDGGGDRPGPRLGIGEVDGCGSFRP
jgi:hypothetical protein